MGLWGCGLMSLCVCELMRLWAGVVVGWCGCELVSWWVDRLMRLWVDEAVSWRVDKLMGWCGCGLMRLQVDEDVGWWSCELIHSGVVGFRWVVSPVRWFAQHFVCEWSVLLELHHKDSKFRSIYRGIKSQDGFPCFSLFIVCFFLFSSAVNISFAKLLLFVYFYIPLRYAPQWMMIVVHVRT